MKNELLWQTAEGIYKAIDSIPSRILQAKCGRLTNPNTVVTAIYLYLEKQLEDKLK